MTGGEGEARVDHFEVAARLILTLFQVPCFRVYWPGVRVERFTLMTPDPRVLVITNDRVH